MKLQLSSGHWKTGSAGRDDISCKGEEEEWPWLQVDGDVARGSADWTEEVVVCSCSCSSSPSEVMRISSRLSIFRGMRLSYSFSYFCAGNGSRLVNWISYRLSSVSPETAVYNPTVQENPMRATNLDPVRFNFVLPSIKMQERQKIYFGCNVGVPSILLKVPSHQIRSVWKWYGWVGLDEYMDYGWYTDF